jgi:hypothetical protein
MKTEIDGRQLETFEKIIAMGVLGILGGIFYEIDYRRSALYRSELGIRP